MAKKRAINGKVITTAEPKKPEVRAEIGRTGTNVFSGVITEEYLPKLSGQRAIKTYDEMRKSDATVKAALSAVQMPIRRAQWFVNPGTDDDKGKEIADFVESCLFEQMSITFDDFLRQALLSTTFGVMLFEKVFDLRTMDGVQRIVWKKFAPRLPKSITAWSMKSGEDGVQQLLSDGKSAEIPMEKLLVFVNEKEGDNWWGISVLRAAYKHWYMKSTLEKIDAMAHERQGLGVPFAKLPQSASDQDRASAINALKNIRAHEEGYLVEEDGGPVVEFKDMKAGGIKDAARAIDYHDRQITKAVLAQFLNLGSGASGSYALSQDHSNLFLQSIEAVASSIADVINKYAIPQLVDLNFDNVEDYPKLDYAGISRTDVEGLSVAYQRLVQSGGIKPIEADDAYLRKVLGLPDSDGANTPDEDAPTPEDVAQDLGIPDLAKKVDSSEMGAAIERRISGLYTGGKLAFLERAVGRVSGVPGMRAARLALSEALEAARRKDFSDSDFKGWRKLTFAEKKVNLGGIQSYMDEAEANLVQDARESLRASLNSYLDKLTSAVNKGDTQKIKDLELEGWGKYRSLVRGYLARAFEFGKSDVAREMGVKAPADNEDVAASIDVLADAIATRHHYEIEQEAKIAVSNELAKFGEKEIKALAKAAVVAGESIDALTRDMGSVVVSSAINRGRGYVFGKNKSKIYALQRSEILDSDTCNFCLSIDGRIVDVNDSIAKVDTFHSNCRGIWVEILKDEEELPEISGVPNSIRDRVGDAVNELVQPKNPIVKKDSLAAEAIEKGKAGQQEASEGCTCGKRHSRG